MIKKDGGTIKNWQVHNLSLTKEQLKTACSTQKLQAMVITATVVDDPQGRWKPGYHMRTSLIVKIDRKKGFVETKNTIYKLTGKEGTDIFKDMGNNVLRLFY
jgi:hypothetical protein